MNTKRLLNIMAVGAMTGILASAATAGATALNPGDILNSPADDV